MKSDLIKVALIGAGRISERHVTAINHTSSRTELVAVCDLDLSRAEDAALGSGASSYSSVSEMLANHPDIGLASICTPSGTHFELATELMKHGKPVLIEKPVTLSTKHSQFLIKASIDWNVPAFVVKQNRLNPPIVEVREKLESGALGRLLSASASVIWCRTPEYYLMDTWRLQRDLDGGVVWNQASHYVDLLVNLLDPVVSVAAVGANYLSPSEAEDTVHAILETKSGQIASLVATTTARPKNFEGSLTLLTEKGVVKIGGHAVNELLADTSRTEKVQISAMVQENPQDSVYGSGHQGLYHQVIADLLDGRRSEFRIENSLETVALMEAIHLAISQKRVVMLSELLGKDQ